MKILLLSREKMSNTQTITRYLLVVLMASAAFGAEKPERVVPRGAKIFIQAESGFDNYLTKGVPIKVVADRDAASYLLDGTSEHNKPGMAKAIFVGIRSDDEATIKLVDVKTNEVVFAYAVNRQQTRHGLQTVAESCARHLKHYVQE